MSVPCGRGRRVRGRWGVFGGTLCDIYIECQGDDVNLIHMDGLMFSMIFVFWIR